MCSTNTRTTGLSPTIKPSIQQVQMDVVQGSKETTIKQVDEVYTLDGSVDSRGQPAVRHRTGKWFAGIILLVNQGLATLAFFGVGVNLVLFLTRVLGQTNADAANNVSKWTGTVYLFSLMGAFLGDSYWGRYRTCAVFQLIFVMGAAFLSLSTHLFLLKPEGCGDETTRCGAHSSIETGLFYVSIYLVALGYGGYQPNIATFGADQFDGEYQKEALSKVAFFSYFYLALNLGSLFSNTILVYYENQGMWVPGFWVSTASIFAALALFLLGTPRFRHFRPSGNPLPRFCQVLVAAVRKSRVEIPEGEALYEVDKDEAENAGRKMLHTDGFKCLDRAALITPDDHFSSQELKPPNPWHLCPVTQVEEVKCVLRLIPIWLCTILYSVVFTQMASLFVEQGNVMNATISSFQIPAASMSSFDIASVAISVFFYQRILNPIVRRTRVKGITELQRMGVGLVIAVMAMISAGVVELYRIKYARKDYIKYGGSGSSSLSIMWQIPQYALIGASEVFMYVGQLEFFNAHTPDGLKSFGSALCMTSMSLGNYVSSLLVSMVMKVTTRDHGMGWIPGDLNKGHLDRFYFLLAGLTAVDFVVYLVLARWYEDAKKEGNGEERNEGV